MIKKTNSQEKIKFTMCSNRTCCPVLSENDDDNFTITDDYNGKVTLTKEELLILKDFLKKTFDK